MTDYLKNKVALITGATRGIGKAVALEFAKKGAHVIAVGRTTSALETLDDEIAALGGSVTLVPLDLKKGEDIDRLGGVVADRWKKLDILVGNAAVLGPISPVGHIQPKNWEELLTVNLTANWRLIRSFDALLKASENGRAIFVSSGAVHANKPYWGGYSMSKAALEELVMTYAAENINTPLRANIIHPGVMRTDMRAQAMPGEDPMTLPEPSAVTGLFVKLCDPTLNVTGKIFRYPADA